MLPSFLPFGKTPATTGTIRPWKLRNRTLGYTPSWLVPGKPLRQMPVYLWDPVGSGTHTMGQSSSGRRGLNIDPSRTGELFSVIETLVPHRRNRNESTFPFYEKSNLPKSSAKSGLRRGADKLHHGGKCVRERSDRTGLVSNSLSPAPPAPLPS